MIYHYFKNKENLMFHTAGNYIRDGLDEFAHHLQGVCEPVSRLSNLMCQHGIASSPTGLIAMTEEE